MKKILIVDPFDSSAKELAGLLNSFPFFVEYIPFALSTAPLISIKPDIVIARYSIDDGVTAALCRMIKRTPSVDHIFVILISKDAHVAHIAQDDSADEYLLEPIKTFHLKRVLR